jgi:membrane protein DedA with SNARE-associated domain
MESIIEFVKPSFETWGYAIVFASALLENSAFVGAVIPGDVVLLLAGFYVQRSDSLDLAPVVVLAFVGALIGDTIGYMIGRYGGRRLMDRFDNRLLSKERLARVDRYFEEYGMWAVALGRITPVVRTINTFAAGAARMPFPRFIVAVAAAASVTSTAMPVVGFLASGSLEAVRRALGWAGVGIFLLFAALIVFTYRRLVRRLDVESPQS